MADDNGSDAEDEGPEEWEHARSTDELQKAMPEWFPDVPPEKLDDPWRGHYDAEREAEEEAFQAYEATIPNWDGIGEALWRARNRLGISKREAARRAGISEAAWRHLEAGKKIVGGNMVEPNPRNENLVGAARAVGLNPRELFSLACRPFPEGLDDPPTDGEVIEGFRRLSPADRELVAGLIERLARKARKP